MSLKHSQTSVPSRSALAVVQKAQSPDRGQRTLLRALLSACRTPARAASCETNSLHEMCGNSASALARRRTSSRRRLFTTSSPAVLPGETKETTSDREALSSATSATTQSVHTLHRRPSSTGVRCRGNAEKKNSPQDTDQMDPKWHKSGREANLGF